MARQFAFPLSLLKFEVFACKLHEDLPCLYLVARTHVGRFEISVGRRHQSPLHGAFKPRRRANTVIRGDENRRTHNQQGACRCAFRYDMARPHESSRHISDCLPETPMPRAFVFTFEAQNRPDNGNDLLKIRDLLPREPCVAAALESD